MKRKNVGPADPSEVAEDTVRRKRMKKYHRQHFCQWANLLPEPLILVRPVDGMIVCVNERAEKLLGRPHDDLIARPIIDILHEPPDRVHDYLQACLRSGSLVTESLTLRERLPVEPVTFQG
ncbi:MAG: PAS domain-containing protein, partial [Planctomycetes bacterium]|nr:PAS domain-containing protein [Planctomycetota bacterium]